MAFAARGLPRFCFASRESGLWPGRVARVLGLDQEGGGIVMTDDEILAAADSIRARRRNDARFNAFLEKDEVMVRWDLPNRAVAGESYASVMVPRKAIQDLVRSKMGDLTE